jgi:hypothetical protein
MLRCFCWFGFAVCDGFRFRFQIDPGVDVCGVDRDVAEPVAHGVDVHTASKKMGRGRAPDVCGLTFFVAKDGIPRTALRTYRVTKS